MMSRWIFPVAYVVALWCALAAPAAAYVGPGAGLSMLGALWGLLLAIVAAFAFLLLWPIRRLLRRRAAASGRTGAPPPNKGAV